MTPRVLFHLLAAIDEAQAVDFYKGLYQVFAGYRAKELPSQDEFLAVTLNKPTAEAESKFDPEVEKMLESYALKRIQEGGANG